MTSISTTRARRAAPATVSTRSQALKAALPDAAIVTFSCVVFLLLCLYQIELPGLYPDEAFDVIPSIQMLTGQPVELLRGASINLFGRDWPLMSSSDYQGVTVTYLAVPFFAFFGINVVSLRLMMVLVGVTALVISYFLARAWFGVPAARVTVLLFAVSPAWVFWSRLGVYVVSVVVPIASGALLALTLWLKRRPFGRHNGSLYTGCFLIGLGLTTKLLFLWFIAAVILTSILLYGRHLWLLRGTLRKHKQPWASTVLSATGAFCLGAFPFLLYNAQTGGTYYLIRSVLSNVAETSHGVDNTALLRNLWTEVDAFKVLMDGGYFWFQGVGGTIYANVLTPALFAISALGLLIIVLWDRSRPASLRFRPVALAAAVLSVSGLLALALVMLPQTSVVNILVAVSAIAALSGSFLSVAMAVRRPALTPVCALCLFITASLSGALWWFAGDGRPAGRSPEGLLGLWPVDAAGILFWTTATALCVVLGWDPYSVRYQKTVVGALAIIGLVVAQSIVTVSGLWSTHLLILLPLPQIVIAGFAVLLGKRLARPLKRYGRSAVAAARTIPVVVIIGSILLLDLGVDYSYHRDLALTGGFSTFSDAIYSLSDFLLEEDPPNVVAMDWGFKRPLQFLTELRIDPLDIYGYSAKPPPDFYDATRELIKDPRNIFLFHTRDGTAFHRHDAFFNEVRSAGKEAVLLRTFHLRDGAPVYELYVVR